MRQLLELPLLQYSMWCVQLQTYHFFRTIVCFHFIDILSSNISQSNILCAFQWTQYVRAIGSQKCYYIPAQECNTLSVLA